jgi:hypothetical protein
MSAAWLDRPVAKAPSDVASKPVKAARPRKPVVIEDEATAG